MDQNGLNVGQSFIISDFWQGDEVKFQKIFIVGNDVVFFDDFEWDDEVCIWCGQVSFIVMDVFGVYKIGVVIVEVNLIEFECCKVVGI